MHSAVARHTRTNLTSAALKSVTVMLYVMAFWQSRPRSLIRLLITVCRIASSPWRPALGQRVKQLSRRTHRRSERGEPPAAAIRGRGFTMKKHGRKMRQQLAHLTSVVRGEQQQRP